MTEHTLGSKFSGTLVKRHDVSLGAAAERPSLEAFTCSKGSDSAAEFCEPE